MSVPSGASSAAPLTLALAGNPNAGKTTLFNALTGARQHVGNYPGVTVERKEGEARLGDRRFTLIDLPGAYSLSARSAEEIVARNVLIEEHPDAVIVVVDASNLERNLYLAVQLAELGVPLVIALNMWDTLEAKGLTVNLDLMTQLTGVPVVATVGNTGRGIRELLDVAAQVAEGRRAVTPHQVNYGHEIEPHVHKLQTRIETIPALRSRARWFALKTLEGDTETLRRIAALCSGSAEALAAEAQQHRVHIEHIFDESIAAQLADRRYGYIAGIVAEAVTQTGVARISRSERIDRIMLNRWLGLPIFAALMYGVFHLTFTLAEPLMMIMENGFSWLSGAVGRWWGPGSDSLLHSLLVDGIIGGVGGVLVFLPTILLLFLAIAMLEDSGYMARAAFIMDRFMHAIGLHGKSFIPMLLGFGCTVPAIMGTRTLESRRDRLTTILVLPLMSCGARLTIYALLIPAFFPEAWHAGILWSLYAIGIALAILMAKLLRGTLLKGESMPFVMELPPYRMPTLRSMLIHMWDRAGYFLRKAGTLILGVSIILWALSTWPRLPDDAQSQFETERARLDMAANMETEQRQTALETLDYTAAQQALQHSAVGRIGRAIAPVFRPLGFDWRVSTAMIGAFAAKEVFVAQMGIVYSMGEADEESATLRDRLREHYSPLQGFAIMLFCLISMPCMATVVMTRREAGGWKWAALQLGGLTALAWVVTALFYQIGRLFF